MNKLRVKVYPELESGFSPEDRNLVRSAGINYPKMIILHHSGGTDKDPMADTSNQTFEIINDYHKKFGMKSSLGYWCGYHIVIQKNGRVVRARNDNEPAAHTIGYNNQSIGICCVGNFDRTILPSAQLDALRGVLFNLMFLHQIPASKVYPHRKFASKTCYGRNLKESWGTNTAKAAIEEEYGRIKARLELISQLEK